MKLRVTQALPRQPIHARRWDRTAERAACSEANVIRQDEQDVWRAVGRFDLLGKVKSRVLDGGTDMAFEGRFRPVKNLLRITNATHSPQNGCQDSRRCN